MMSPGPVARGSLSDKVAIVTGAGSGIGRATAARLAAEGAAVACLDVADDAARETAAIIAGAGGRAVSVRCDVADAAEVTAAVAAVVDQLGPPQVLCNIAGIGRFAHTTEMALADWQRIIDVNLTGTFLMAQAVLPCLVAGGGVIINTASNAGLHGLPYSAAYCASKGGVVMLTKSLAYEYIERGVRVNAVAPGGVNTPLTKSFQFPDAVSGKLLLKMQSPMGMAEPEDLAGLFAFLASDEARYMTGAIVAMDGGVTC
jgi:NAD(P)-dependent dehydrogenase (short-subunit alcohol dehydrogenase family)